MMNHILSNTLNLIDHQPFESETAQEIFLKWCEINDGIVPKFLERAERESEKTKGILQRNPDNTQTLILPKDLQLWEVIDIIEIIDQNTFPDKVEKQKEKSQQILALGKQFEQAGLYLASYLEILKEDLSAQEIAKEMAEKFYQYGLSLQNKKKIKSTLPEKIELSELEKDQAGKWLLGSKIYQKRVQKLGENPNLEEKEKMRQETYQSYFKALTREGYKSTKEDIMKLHRGPFMKIQENTKQQLIQTLKTPSRELDTAVFQRGVEKLIHEMPIPKEMEIYYRIYRPNNFPKLAEHLNLEQLKQELATVRATQDLQQISEKELAIAKRVQDIISRFEYKDFANHPSQMILTQEMNCLGSAILGIGVLEELGINSFYTNLPGHIVTLLQTSDNKIYRQDFTPGTKNRRHNYREITLEMIENPHHKSMEKLLHDIQEHGISLVFEQRNPYLSKKDQEKLKEGDETRGLKLFAQITKSEPGLQSTIYNNLGGIYFKIGEKQEANKNYQKAIENYQKAIEICKKAIEIDPNNYSAYNNLGIAYSKNGEYKKAIDTYLKSIEINPDDYLVYYNLGNAYSNNGEYQKAIEIYLKSIEINPDDYSTYYNLGNAYSKNGEYQKAIDAFEIFIDNRTGDAKYILYAKKDIIELQQKIKNQQK